MRRRNKFIMANATPSQWYWLAPLLDVMGTEANWNPGDNWNPMSDEDLIYRRALCKGKPYCFLMNTDFTRFTREMSEKFMKRALAYGMFPGFFSADASTGHYFRQPALYNRDRELFKTYVPRCKQVAEAGWEPITGAQADHPGIVIERFGKLPADCYLTLYNPLKERIKTRITLRLANAGDVCRDLLNDRERRWQSDRTLEIELASEDVLLLQLQPKIELLADQ